MPNSLFKEEYASIYKLPQLIVVLGIDSLSARYYQDYNQKDFFNPSEILMLQEFLEFHLQLTGAVFMI